MGIKVLETLNLISKSTENGLDVYKIIPQGNKKINLFDTDIYNSVQAIGRASEAFAKVAQNKHF